MLYRKYKARVSTVLFQDKDCLKRLMTLLLSDCRQKVSLIVLNYLRLKAKYSSLSTCTKQFRLVEYKVLKKCSQQTLILKTDSTKPAGQVT